MMRDVEHMKRHLRIETRRDGELVEPAVRVCDPFHVTNVVIAWSLWDWLKLLFCRERSTSVRVSVVADSVALRRWFQGQDTCERCRQVKIGPLPGVHETEPGYHHGDERWCEQCYYGYEPEESVTAEISRSLGMPEKMINESSGPHYGSTGIA